MRVSPAVYRHTQASASAEWNIAHNLGNNGGDGVPIVDVLVDFDGNLEKIIPLTLEKVDRHNVKVTFSAPRTGVAIVIV